MTRYWSYTTACVPRTVDASHQRVHDYIVEMQRIDGAEYRASCMDEDHDGMTPEDLVSKLNTMYPMYPLTVLVTKRAITKEEYEMWYAEMERFTNEEAAYLRGTRDLPPEW